MKKILVLFFLVISVMSFAQEKNEAGFFEVTFDEFSLPTKDLITSLENSKAMPFMAPDVDGKQQFLGDYKGKTVIVYFMNKDCSSCFQQIASLNLIQDELKKDVQVIGIMDEAKEEAKVLCEQNGITFPTLYNGKLLGEAAYGIELGYPRLFAVDKNGVIKHVIPSATLANKSDIYLQLKNLIKLVQGQ